MRQLLIVNIIIFNRKTYEKGGVSCDDVGLAVSIFFDTDHSLESLKFILSPPFFVPRDTFH